MIKMLIVLGVVFVGIYFYEKNLRRKKNPRLIDDIPVAAYWISDAMRESGYGSDFTLESLKEIDRFFAENMYEGKVKPGGLLSVEPGKRLFALGCYIGVTLIRSKGGEWITDDSDEAGETSIMVKFTDGTMIWPVQRVMKRFVDGEENGIYAYGHGVVNKGEILEKNS